MSTEDCEVLGNEFKEISGGDDDEKRQKIVIDREFPDELTSRITWLHSKRTFITTAEITMNPARNINPMSPDLCQLCEKFKNLDCEN